MLFIIGKQITQVAYILTYDSNYYIKMYFGYKEKCVPDENLLLELINQEKLQSRDDSHAKSWKVIAIIE